MDLKRTFKLFTAVVLKRTDKRLGRCSTVAVALCRLTPEEAKDGLMAADVVAV